MRFVTLDNPLIRRIVALFILLTVMIPGPALAQDKPAAKAPAVSVPDPGFDFKTVLDGTRVKHDYRIRNTGSTGITITDVKSDCSCTTVDYPGSIPPGGEALISMILDTTGYGGNTLSRTITVFLSDPDTPRVELTLTGTVDTFATVSPANVSLAGPPGRGTRTEVTITPSPKYPFSIVGTSLKSGKNITCSLSRTDGAYVLTIENTLDQPGRYFEIITLTTDNPAQTELKIRVMGIIRNS